MRIVNPAALLPKGRVHFPEGQEFKTLCDSIQKLGILNPIALRGKKILDGRLRVLAALKVGVMEVPAYDVPDDAAEPLPKPLRSIPIRKSDRVKILRILRKRAVWSALKPEEQKLIRDRAKKFNIPLPRLWS